MNEQILEIAKGLNLTIENGFIKLFHGTSKGNATGINKKGFKGFPWFAIDEPTAKKYANATGGKPVILTVWVHYSALYYNGYFSALHELSQVSENRYK